MIDDGSAATSALALAAKTVLRASSTRQRDAFKFGILLSRESAMRNPKLNGCRHSLPPHA